jgi:hypothetical protein
MNQIEKKLLEEVARFRAINKYAKNLLNEQDATMDAGLPPADADVPPMDAGAPPADMGAPVDAGAPPADMGAPVEDNTEEIDITDLVNMTKSIKKDVDDSKSEHLGVTEKMDSVFTKLTDLEQKLSQMDSVIDRIDQLGTKIDSMKEKTPEEKLELRSLDSYPFNQNPQEFFSQKQGEMKVSGKNDYVLTKQDVDDYSKDMIKNSFNPEEEQDEYKF